jgi:arylsulfatase A-like enzyme
VFLQRKTTFPRGVLLLLAAWGASACSQGSRGPNILLVTMDTVRADHLSGYGYERDTTPHLDRFASSATRYERAYATAPWTVPTHASFFTGRFPFQHGARSFRPPEWQPDNVYPLSPDSQTLAEVLSECGYDTAAFVSNDAYLRPGIGLDQGFGTYRVDRVRAPALNRLVRAWLDAPRERPFFLFVNYMDAHRPYNTEPAPNALPVPLRDEKGELVLRLKQEVMGGEGPVPNDLRERVIEQYDTGIAHIDAALGELFEDLERRGLYRDMLIIITSDHGEYFGEHRLVEHSKDVYEPALRIPLLVKRPGQRDRVVEGEPFSAVDLPHLISRDLPTKAAERFDFLFPYRPGNHPVIAESYFARPHDLFHPTWGPRFDRERIAFLSDGYKLIESSDGRHELYDLRRDPDESENLFASSPEIAREMREKLAAFQREAGGRKQGVHGKEPTPEEIEALRELGYLDSAVVPGGADSSK